MKEHGLTPRTKEDYKVVSVQNRLFWVDTVAVVEAEHNG